MVAIMNITVASSCAAGRVGLPALPRRCPFVASNRVARSHKACGPAAAASASPLASDHTAPQEAAPLPSLMVRAKEWATRCAQTLGVMMLAVILAFSAPATAEAARSGGRMGGGGFTRSMGSGGMGGMGGGGSSMGRSAYAASPGMAGSRSPSVVHHVHHRPSFGFGFFPMGGYYGGGMMGGGGGGLFSLLLIGIFAYVAINSMSGALGAGDDEYEEEDDIGREPMSVVKMQIGLLGTARGLQQDLNRMATSTDTSTPAGLHYLLQETVLSLRRNPQYAVYGKAELVKTRGLDNAEAKFNAMSMDERGKFEQETMSNFGGRKSSKVVQSSGDGMNELIVITIIAAVDGKLEPQDINDSESLKANMNLLGSVPRDRLLALEVLWTPQDEGDYFTKEELVTDYPTLNTL